MTWANARLGVNEIKNHPFFYGADWDNLRYIAPPFVPALSSITDTTYFPTDELGNLPEQLEVVEQVGSDKDLAFLGLVMRWVYIDFADAIRSNSGSLSNASLVDKAHDGIHAPAEETLSSSALVKHTLDRLPCR